MRPAAATRPARSTATRSHVRSISESRCELSSTVFPRFASSWRRSRISRRPTGSTPSVGSSSRSTSGSWIRAAARPSRCVMPLENFFTRTSAHSERRTRSRSSGARSPQDAGVHARHPPEDRQRLAGRQVSGEPMPLRQVTDAPPALGVRGRKPEQARPPRGGPGQAQQDLHRRRLAGAVWPKQTKDLALLDPQVDAAQRRDPAGAEAREIDLRRGRRPRWVLPSTGVNENRGRKVRPQKRNDAVPSVRISSRARPIARGPSLLRASASGPCRWRRSRALRPPPERSSMRTSGPSQETLSPFASRR